jgi:hypothetical protein
MEVLRLRLADIDYDKQPWLRGDSLFSSPEFLGLWKDDGGVPLCLAVADQGVPIAALPGTEFGRLVWRRFQAAPDGCYARLLSAPGHEESRDQAAAAILSFIEKEKYVKAVINDFYRHFDDHESFETVSAKTRLVDVDPDWQPPDRKLRQQIRRAMREGRVVAPFDATRHMDDLLTLVRMTAERTGTKPFYSRGFYERLAALARRDDRVRWTWLTDDDGAPVASSIFLTDRDQLLHWQMYYDSSYGDLQPNKWVPWLMIKQALDKGVTTYNLGASPQGADGVDEYKRKWGGRIYEYRCLVRKGRLSR